MGCFGGDKSSGSSTTVTEREPTAEEKEQIALMNDMTKATAPYQKATQIAGLSLAEQLLKGSEPLPGFFNELSQGISPEVTQSIVNQSLKDIAPSFQSAGILDSGVAASISARTSADIRRASEEYNIGNRLNLLNLALSGQAQVQAPVLATSSQLLGTLGTLGRTTSSSTWQQGNNNTIGRQFMSSFATSLGSGMGGGMAGGMGGMMGGDAGAGWTSALAGAGCWVAKAIYGSWEDERTIKAKFFINEIGPKWFKRFYWKYGPSFGEFISDKPFIKAVLKPIFDLFGFMAEVSMSKVRFV